MTGFLNVTMKSLVPQKMYKSLVALRAPLLFRSVCTTGAIEVTRTDYNIFVNKQQWVEYDLLSLPFLTTLSAWQDSMRLAILIAGMTTDVPFQPTMSYARNIVEQLRQSCQDIAPEELTVSLKKEVFVWILFIGCLLSKGLKERTWFVLKLAKVGRDFGVDSCDTLRALLKKFIFLDWVHEEKLHEIWREIEVLTQAVQLLN